MIPLFQKENGFGAIEAMVGTAIALFCGGLAIGGLIIFGQPGQAEYLNGFQKLAFLPIGLVVVSFHLRFKLLELPGRGSYSVSEQRRLGEILRHRTRTLSCLVFLYIFSSLILALVPLIGIFDILRKPLVGLAGVLLGVSLHSLVVVLQAFNELEDFKLILDEREAEGKERERLLKKLNHNSDHP